MKAECPKDWYTEDAIRDWLKREGVPQNRDLPSFLAKHLQLALEKGWQLRDGEFRAHAAECYNKSAKAAEEMCSEEEFHGHNEICPICSDIAARIRSLATSEEKG